MLLLSVLVLLKFGVISGCISMSALNDPLVQISSGLIRGRCEISRLDTKYYSFQGIPYAQPPVGNLRFKDPIAVKPWKNIFQCRPPTMCSQRDILSQKIMGSEDCLVLNVYTKQINSNGTPLPVMVFIHGGGFIRGSSATDIYGPDYLMEKDVILVTLNYRLGPLGFLSLEDPAAGVPGNAGLKDQVLALKWVKENIAQFGGDNNDITLFGQSAGAISVHMHMISPMTEGLFQKAIVQSGSSIGQGSILIPRGLQLAKQVGWNGQGGDKEALKHLQTIDALTLTEAQEKLLTIEDLKQLQLFAFGPVIEPYQSEQCFLPAHPLHLIRGEEVGWGWGLDIPLIIGVVADEGLTMHKLIKDNPLIPHLLGDFEGFVPTEFEITDANILKQMGKSIRNFYFGDQTPSADTIEGFVRLITDKLFVHAVHRSIRHHRGKLFAYRFAVDSMTNNQYKLLTVGPIPGVAHADDLFYLFLSEKGQIYAPETLEHRSIQLMTSCWTNFASTNNPNLAGTSLEWSEHGTESYYLNIAEKVSLEENLGKEAMKFWDNLYKQAGVEL